ncbi:hypothetical protein [Streptosporangium carneum]|uniref:Uncharacterized protein n=1 Tax=Streptosporangium carneum TaxID=47481 RepID=A0A9W6IBT8_9ACTN|nr:hypothetical protein [Streptosporangium carneum]GLK15171.1 hypothetical protein GCM10017600_85840 [Streptosporangium carneum]
MAVPPIQPDRGVVAGSETLARPLRASLVLDVVLGLLVAVTLPLAIVAIPNTVSVVAALLPPDISQVEMVRAHGLALPAMVLTVPLAALLLRRVRAVPILVAGLTLLALADAAGGYAESSLLVGVLRVLHGVGAGLLVPASLVAVWERSLVLRAVWGGMLAVSLLAAQALALWPLDEVRSWRVTLQPYPMLTGVALALAAVCLVLWVRGGEGAAEPVPLERGRLPVAAGLAAAIAALALGTTFDWPPGLLVLTAALSILALFCLASACGFEGVFGRASAYTTLAIGVVVLPTAAQVTYVELGGLGGPGLSGLWLAFAIAGITGLVAAVLASRLGDAVMPLCAAGGLVVVVAGLCAVRLLLPAAEGPALILPFVLLTVGTAVALTSALRPSGAGAALFALSLFFPGVLSGFLLGSGIQVTRLKEAGSPQAMVDAFVDALHLWALVGGGLVVVMIVLGAVLASRLPAVRAGAAGALPRVELPPVEGLDDVQEEEPKGEASAASSAFPTAFPAVPAPAPPVDSDLSSSAGARGESASGAVGGLEEDRPGHVRPEPEPKTGPRPKEKPGNTPSPAARPEADPDKPGALPVVPPPTPSPEGALGDGADRP